MVTTHDTRCKEGTTLLEDIVKRVTNIGDIVTGIYESVNTLLEHSEDVQDMLSNRIEYRSGSYGYDEMAQA